MLLVNADEIEVSLRVRRVLSVKELLNHSIAKLEVPTSRILSSRVAYSIECLTEIEKDDCRDLVVNSL